MPPLLGTCLRKLVESARGDGGDGRDEGWWVGVLGAATRQPHSISVLAIEALLAVDIGEDLVERYPVVIEGGRLQDDAGSAHQYRQREDPQEESVQHHGHVFPVFLHLSVHTRVNTHAVTYNVPILCLCKV